MFLCQNGRRSTWMLLYEGHMSFVANILMVHFAPDADGPVERTTKTEEN